LAQKSAPGGLRTGAGGVTQNYNGGAKVERPEGYNEEFIEFWCEDKAEGMGKLPFWRFHQDKVGTSGGPAKIWWGAPVEAMETYFVDAWELKGAIDTGGLPEQDLEALLEWAKVNEADAEAVWPVCLVFTPDTPDSLTDEQAQALAARGKAAERVLGQGGV